MNERDFERFLGDAGAFEKRWDARFPGTEPYRFIVGVCLGRMRNAGFSAEDLDEYLSQVVAFVHRLGPA